MAIALNRGNVNSARSSSLRSHRPSVVPSASVWEPSVCEVRVNNVRTLGGPDRTAQRNSFERPPSSRDNVGPESVESTASVRSNLALGAIFGAALFAGTLFAGLSAPDESTQHATTISSSSVNGEVISR